MSLDIALVFLIILAVIILFALEVFPIDKIAFSLIGVLVLMGLVTPEEAISGFSNRATITILCLMILAAALEQNGVISWMANGLKRLRNWNFALMVPAFMLITGSISAFISSTAVVIVFIKVITELHDKYDISKSRLLLPISFASILGGSCTLMGTSTNLIVNALYVERTGDRIGFFEFSWMGVSFLLLALLLFTFLWRVLPQDSTKKLRDEYDLGAYIMTLELAADSRLINKRLPETFLGEEKQFTVLKLSRNGQDKNDMLTDLRLQAGDRILVSCDLESLLRLKSNREFIITPHRGPGTLSPYEFKDTLSPTHTPADGQPPPRNILVELMMLPGARFLGKTLRELKASLGNLALPIAIKKRKNLRHSRDRLYRSQADLTQLKVGDRVLVETKTENLKDFDLYDNIAILQQYDAPEIAHSSKRNLTLIVLAAVVLLAATGTLSILASAILGVTALLLTNSISLENVYKKINWPVIFLLAGMIPLGTAMHNSGADDWISDQLLSLLLGQHPTLTLSLLFLGTMLLSGVVSNNATAIIMTPIAISLATGLETPLEPYVFAVMFASNFSFFTPVGYQTNTIIYSMGLYSFRHFLILGSVVSVLLWILATFLLNTMLY